MDIQSPRSVAEARELRSRARDHTEQIDELFTAETTLQQNIAEAYPALRERQVRDELDNYPLSRLRDVTRDRLRLTPLEDAGITTVLQVYDSTTSRLELLPGIGAKTAYHLVAAARQLGAAARDEIPVRIDFNPFDDDSSAVIQPLHQLLELDQLLRDIQAPAAQLAADLGPAIQTAGTVASRWKKTFSSSQRRDDAHAALDTLDTLISTADSAGLLSRIATGHNLLINQPSREAAWHDFQRRSPEFYGLLDRIVDLGNGDIETSAGFLPAEMVERIASHPLDDSLLGVSLRGYQAFGARFALAQKRVLLGDEMGLGKTIEAIAVIAHLRSTGATHFLVACPSSVLINWTREVRSRSLLTPYALHGPTRADTQHSWERHGGVAITTLDILHTLNVDPEVKIAQFVVDEAHYVKNYRTRRSQAVADWVVRTPRVLFLTGTPLENRVEEFRTLVRYLQPQVAASLDGKGSVAGAVQFRRAVAPVYLRRNQSDVLMELPDRISTDEWVEFGRQDRAAYYTAVEQKNFMAMRRAAFVPQTPHGSAKLERLLQIVEESIENNLKVVIFTYFRDVLDTVTRAIDEKFVANRVAATKIFGPISGSTTPTDRQRIVDEFSTRLDHSVLISQIQAGGTGLNIQAASIVIICEPQVKPSLEQQAIARLHRMGQVRTVQSHRLLATQGVDQRMVEILSSKEEIFDEYARRSALADDAPEAVDISEARLARQIVTEEYQRIFGEAIEPPEEPEEQTGRQDS